MLVILCSRMLFRAGKDIDFGTAFETQTCANSANPNCAIAARFINGLFFVQAA
jgi:hypothetical protein